MDKSQDLRRKFSLLVVGNRAVPGLEGEQHLDLTGLAWQNSFVCLSGTSDCLHALLREAQQLRVPAEQILLCVESIPLPFQPPTSAALIEPHPGECPDEFRQRLAQKCETMRQQKLLWELDRLDKLGAFDSLTPGQAVHARDQARFAHALACGYDLGPSSHSLVIRGAAALGLPASARVLASDEVDVAPAEPGAPWPSTATMEQILPLAAALALNGTSSPAAFREHFRERSVQLPFRARNELKGHLEKILEPLWGGKHAA